MTIARPVSATPTHRRFLVFFPFIDVNKPTAAVFYDTVFGQPVIVIFHIRHPAASNA
jgi:hypothetical protein